MFLTVRDSEASHAAPELSSRILYMTSRVQRYAERARVEPTGAYVDLYYVPHPPGSYQPHQLAGNWPDLPASGAQVAWDAGVFSLEVADPSGDWRPAATAFNRVQPVEYYEAQALRLFAALQNGPALGRASVERLRDLELAAREEGEPFSLDALEALVAFANAYPDMALPELTLSTAGGIMAEWRRSAFSVTLYFVSAVNVQYLVKHINPRHPQLGERSSGTTTVDLVGDRVRALLPATAWPIRA
jgi:hypothetical protein